MKFGVMFLTGDLKKMGDAAVEAENLGYDGVFSPDHIGILGRWDPWITLSYVAAKTTRLRVGTWVINVPRYVPGHLATLISNLDAASNGRFIAGVGVGNDLKNEYRNYSPQGIYEEASVRVERFGEALRLLLKLLEAPHPYYVNFKGKYYSTLDATVYPKCVQQPHPPIWGGGPSPKSLRIAAELCDGWIGPIFGASASYPAEVYEARVKKIEKIAKECNRDMSKFTFVGCGSMYDAGIPIENLYATGGRIMKIDSVEFVEQYRAAGCQYWLVANQFMHQFAEEILPSFK